MFQNKKNKQGKDKGSGGPELDLSALPDFTGKRQPLDSIKHAVSKGGHCQLSSFNLTIHCSSFSSLHFRLPCIVGMCFSNQV